MFSDYPNTLQLCPLLTLTSTELLPRQRLTGGLAHWAFPASRDSHHCSRPLVTWRLTHLQLLLSLQATS